MRKTNGTICNMKILAIVESLTGNTMSFIEYAEEIYGNEITVKKVDPFTYIDDSEWRDYDKVMLGCYTWGMGKMPVEMKDFIIDYRDILLEQDILLFGSGWTVYETYCWAVDGMGIILDNKFPKAKFELRFDPDLEDDAIKTLNDFIGGK